MITVLDQSTTQRTPQETRCLVGQALEKGGNATGTREAGGLDLHHQSPMRLPMGRGQLDGQEFVGPLYYNRAVGITSRLGLMTTYLLVMWLYFY